jgi:hypothetical protein
MIDSPLSTGDHPAVEYSQPGIAQEEPPVSVPDLEQSMLAEISEISTPQGDAEGIPSEERIAESIPVQETADAASSPSALEMPILDDVASEPGMVEPVPELAVEPVMAEPVPEPAVEPVPEPAVEPVMAEPVPEPTVEPVLEPAVEPVMAEPVPEPAVEPVMVEPVPEPAVEPVMVEPVPEPSAVPDVQDGTTSNVLPEKMDVAIEPPLDVAPAEPVAEDRSFNLSSINEAVHDLASILEQKQPDEARPEQISPIDAKKPAGISIMCPNCRKSFHYEGGEPKCPVCSHTWNFQ